MSKAAKKATAAKKKMPTTPGRPREYTPAQIEKALRSARGNISEAARMLKCGRSTVVLYIERYPELKNVVTEAREAMLDFAESKLRQHIENDSERMLQFFLQTQGRRRGYRTDTNGLYDNGSAVGRIVIEIIDPAQDKDS